MRVRLAQGRVARARRVHEPADNAEKAKTIAESAPNTWPRFLLDWIDGVPHLIDIDMGIEEVDLVDLVEGGDL